MPKRQSVKKSGSRAKAKSGKKTVFEHEVTAKQATAGENGGRGYRAQNAYALLMLQDWLSMPEFESLLIEAMGDVDVRWIGSRRRYTQIKDYLVQPGEFRDILRL